MYSLFPGCLLFLVCRLVGLHIETSYLRFVHSLCFLDILKNMVLLTSASGTLLNYSKLSNYFLKMSNLTISNVLIIQTLIKIYHLMSLTSVHRH